MKIKMFALIGILSILLVSGIACGESSPTTYQLTTVVEGQGIVSPSSGTYTAGDSITLTANPSAGWTFSHWGGHGSGTQNPITIIMTSSKTVYAYFTEIETNPTATTPPANPTATMTSLQGEQAYNADKTAIQSAVFAYINNHAGNLPYLQDPGQEVGTCVGGEDFCLIDMCKLVPTYLDEIPQSCNDQTTSYTADNCGVLEESYHGCYGCHTNSHYIWWMTASGIVHSTYILGGESTMQDGYQGVYP